MGKEQLQLFNQYRQQEEQFKNTLGVDVTQHQQADSPMQALQQVWKRTTDLMIETILPDLEALGKAARALADALQLAADYMHSHQLIGRIITESTAGAVGGAVVGTIVPGVGTGAGALLGGMAGGLHALVHGAPEYGSQGQIHIPMPFSHPFSLPPGQGPVVDPRSSGSDINSMTIHRQSFQGGGGSPAVVVQNINFGPGTPHDHADEFLGILARKLGRGSMNDLGTGSGGNHSGFSLGRTVSI